MGSFHGKSARYNFLKYLLWPKTWLNPYMAKSQAKKFKKLLEANLFYKYSQFWKSLYEIKMLANFSTKQVLPEFWQDSVWEHLWTMHVLSQDSSLTLWQPKKSQQIIAS